MAGTIEEALRAFLSTHPDTAAVLGDRIFPDELPGGKSFPAVVVQVVSSDLEYSQEGDSNYTTDRVQFDCWAVNRAEAIEAAQALRTVLSGRRFSAAGVRVMSSFLSGVRPGSYEESLKLWRVSRDYTLSYALEGLHG